MNGEISSLPEVRRSPGLSRPKLLSAQGARRTQIRRDGRSSQFATPLRRQLKPSLLQIKPRLKAGLSA